MTYTSKCPPGHRHQDATTCYTTHKCRCAPCVEAWTNRNAKIRKEIAYGRYISPLIDATPAVTHINHLRTIGLTYAAIAIAADIDINTIIHLADGRSRQTTRHTERKILDVTRDSTALPEKSWFPATGAHRRLQALVARGWSLSALAREAGITPQRIQQIITRPRITVGVHRRMVDLYERLWDQRPPLRTPGDKAGYAKAITMATRRGWVPPLAWDDIDNDPAPTSAENDTTVDEFAVELAIAGIKVPLNHGEKLEGLRQMHPKKWSNSLIAERLGCEERTVNRLREELGLPGWDQSELVGRKAA